MSAPARLAFDDVVLDLAGQRLLRGGVEQSLEPKAFAVLALLAGSPGRVFGRDEILDAVWGHQHVTPGVLSRSINLLRQALGEDSHHPRRLHTVHGVGYRFDLPAAAPGAEATTAVRRAPDGPSPPSPAVAPVPQPVRRRWLWLATAAAIALPVAIVIAIAWLPQSPGEAAQAKPPAVTDTRPSIALPPSVAVLPFVDLSPTRDQAYLGDGLAEEILNQLAQVPALRVIGRTSSFSFKGKDEDSRSIGRTLGVAHLLEGSVRRDGDRLRVSAQLVRADDGTQLWAQTYARELRDVFAVQDEIARDVAQALSVTLDAVTLNRAQGGTTNLQAYDRFLRWRSLYLSERTDPESIRQRMLLAREMVALDPAFVLGWDALGSSLERAAFFARGAEAERLDAEARQAYARIARIMPDSWIAKRERAYTLWREGRRAEAVGLTKQIMDAGPLTVEHAYPYTNLAVSMGHLQETVAVVDRVKAIEPLAMYVSRDQQWNLTMARRYAEAEAEYQRSLGLDGRHGTPAAIALLRHLALEDVDARTLRELHGMALGPHSPQFARDIGLVLDDRVKMRAMLRAAVADPEYGGEWAYLVADALGDADLAVAGLRSWLESRPGFREGRVDYPYYYCLWMPSYSNLRAHRGFKKLLVEMGVVDYWRQTGKWGDGCAPAGSDDFRCQ